MGGVHYQNILGNGGQFPLEYGSSILEILIIHGGDTAILQNESMY